jgi:hypothetical protein
MSFDDNKRNKLAVQSQLADIAIDTAVAFDRLTDALRKISQETGVDIIKDIETVEEISRSLGRKFDELTGYIAEPTNAS